MQWFECKVKYDKMVPEAGGQKVVTEVYLVDALSFTEAEARITEEMRPYTTGEFAVTAVKRVKYDDIFFHQGGDRWYKRTASNSLVQATEFKEALDIFLENMRGTAFDYEIAAIDETPLMDVFAADLAHTLADKEKKEEE